MTRSADDKRARFLEAQHSPDVPATTARQDSNGPKAGTPTPDLGCRPCRVVEPLRELHLFAGAGGGILGGLLLGHTPVCAVEIDAYCRKVLKARQRDGCLPQFPIYQDVRQFDGTAWRGRVDIVAGGFPCQPWSQAGKQKGADDPRHLWPEMARIVEEVRPRYVFAENVSLAAFEEPWRDLRGLGYRVPPSICVAASDVGAPHQRRRWWLLAALDGDSHDTSQPTSSQHDEARRLPTLGEPSESGWWDYQPDICRVVDGMANRVDRLRALGNGQVPMAAATAWRYLMEQLVDTMPR